MACCGCDKVKCISVPVNPCTGANFYIEGLPDGEYTLQLIYNGETTTVISIEAIGGYVAVPSGVFNTSYVYLGKILDSSDNIVTGFCYTMATYYKRDLAVEPPPPPPTPTQVFPKSGLLAMGTLDSIQHSGGNVTQWDDISGNNNHLTSINDSPQYSASVGVVGDVNVGSQDLVFTDGTLPLNSDGELTAYFWAAWNDGGEGFSSGLGTLGDSINSYGAAMVCGETETHAVTVSLIAFEGVFAYATSGLVSQNVLHKLVVRFKLESGDLIANFWIDGVKYSTVFDDGKTSLLNMQEIYGLFEASGFNGNIRFYAFYDHAHADALINEINASDWTDPLEP